MKLRSHPQDLESQLSEFDNWITPSLKEIKDSTQFNDTRSVIAHIIEIIGAATEEFTAELSASLVAGALIGHVDQPQVLNKNVIVGAFLNFLFLVTGKSDNNSKCQFPVFLGERYFSEGFPELKKVAGKTVIRRGSIPRVIKAETVARTILRLKIDSSAQKTFLVKYINFILNETDFWKSLKAIGLGYYRAKLINYEMEYLLPLVVFQLRGSLSATGGHEPENILRAMMREWGLVDNVDFNVTDHVIKPDGLGQADAAILEVIKKKTRAYDFVLPLVSENIQDKVLIQSQFYAGDSGSVSHKNIDQTRASRDYTKSIINNVHFVEFLDGAGYYSSLNGDLKKLLQMQDTYDFIQLRTAAIKLRRVLQEIGFLTPLEVVHACNQVMGSATKTLALLADQGYSSEEIGRAVAKAVDNGFISRQNDMLMINDEYRIIARRYFLLDAIAEYGTEFDRSSTISGVLLIPGFSDTYGIRLSEIHETIIPCAGLFSVDWFSSGTLLNDIQFLADRRWIKQC